MPRIGSLDLRRADLTIQPAPALVGVVDCELSRHSSIRRFDALNASELAVLTNRPSANSFRGQLTSVAVQLGHCAACIACASVDLNSPVAPLGDHVSAKEETNPQNSALITFHTVDSFNTLPTPRSLARLNVIRMILADSRSKTILSPAFKL